MSEEAQELQDGIYMKYPELFLEAAQECEKIRQESASVAFGMQVRIICEWRDQPHGTSKPNLKGKCFRVVGLDFEYGNAYLWLEGLTVSIPVSNVQFLFHDNKQN